MNLSMDLDSYNHWRCAAEPNGGIAVKRSDVDLYSSSTHMTAFGLLASPVTPQGSVASDTQLRDHITKHVGDPVVVVGHSWLAPTDCFVWTMTSDEFLEHWKGD